LFFNIAKIGSGNESFDQSEESFEGVGSRNRW